MTKVFDCAVIGGGSIGLSIAYLLSQRDLCVAVCDAQRVTHQASWAAAGIIPPADFKLAHDDWQRLVARGHELHPIWAQQLLEATGIDVEYERCGGVHFARTIGESASLDAAAKQWTLDGIEIERLDSEQLVHVEPMLARDDPDSYPRRAYWLPSEARVRPPRFLKALRAACLANGVVFIPELVQQFQRTDDRIYAAVMPTCQVAADKFCLATGAWTGAELERLGIRIEVKPWRGQIALVRSVRCGQSMVRIVNEGPNYMVPRSDGRVAIGSTVEDVGFAGGITDAAIEALLEFACQVAPRWQFKLESTWSGLRPGSGDGLPYLGFSPNVNNLFVATGHFRSGIALAPATAELAFQQLFETTPAAISTLFRLDRESN